MPEFPGIIGFFQAGSRIYNEYVSSLIIGLFMMMVTACAIAYMYLLKIMFENLTFSVFFLAAICVIIFAVDRIHKRSKNNINQ